MSVLLQIVLLAIVLASVLGHRDVRNWIRSNSKTNLGIACAVTLFVVSGHFLDLSRSTFPFVRWAMYTEVYEPEEIEWAKFQGTLADGTVVWVNPAQQFRSVNRNSFERLYDLAKSTERGTLTPTGEKVLTELMVALAAKYNRSHANDPLVEIAIVLQEVNVSNQKTVVRNRIVAQRKIASQNTEWTSIHVQSIDQNKLVQKD